MTQRVESNPSWKEHIAPLGKWVTSYEIANAHLAISGDLVWAIVGYSRSAGGDLDRVAADFKITRSAVDAAMAYYNDNKAFIDAKLPLNE